MRIRNLIWGVVSGTVCSLMIFMQVLAYTYYAPITVVSASAYNMLAMIGTVNNTTLVNGGFITSTGLDTDVTFGTSVPHMLATDRVVFADDLPIGTKGFKYEMGNTPETVFEIVCGYGGYITTADDPALEMNNSFSLDIDGYYDTTTAVGSDIAQKADAFDMYVSGTSEVTAAIFDDMTNKPQELFAYAYHNFEWQSLGIGNQSSAFSQTAGSGSVIPADGTISKLWANGTASKTVTLYKNGVATALAAVTDGTGKGYNLVDTVAVTAGDRLNFRRDNAATPFYGSISVLFEPDTAKEYVYMGGEGDATWGNNAFMPLVGQGWGQTSLTYTDCANLTSGNGTATTFFACLNDDPTAAGTITLALSVNGVATAATLTFGTGETAKNITGLSIDIEPGDLLNIKESKTGAPVATEGFWGVVIEPDTDGESFAINGGDIGTMPTGADLYFHGHDMRYDYHGEQYVVRHMDISDMMVTCGTAPGANKSWTYTLYVNNNPTDLSCTIANSGTSSSDLTHTVSVNPGDYLDVVADKTNDPAQPGKLRWGFVAEMSDVDLSVTATGVTSGEHDIVVSADTTELTITVDAVEKDSALLNGCAVPDNANDYVFAADNTLPYAEYIKLQIAGSNIIWYQPNDIIEQVTGDWILPDRQGAQQEGVITWGTNPVTVTVGALVGGVVEPTNTATNITTLPPIVPPGETVPIVTNPPVTSSIFNPFFDVIDDLTDHKFTPEWQGMAYATLLCAGFIIFVGSRTQSFFLAIAAGSLGLGLGYLLRFFADLWIFWVFGFLALAALLLDARKSW